MNSLNQVEVDSKHIKKAILSLVLLGIILIGTMIIPFKHQIQEKNFNIYATGWLDGAKGRGNYNTYAVFIKRYEDTPDVGYVYYTLEDGEDTFYISHFYYMDQEYWSYKGTIDFKGKEDQFTDYIQENKN